MDQDSGGLRERYLGGGGRYRGAQQGGVIRGGKVYLPRGQAEYLPRESSSDCRLEVYETDQKS